MIILPPIDHILHIDHLIFYLIQQNVVFVKDELAILLDRKNLGTQHRIAKRKSFQRDCRLTKTGNQFVRQFFIQPCGKCRMLHQLLGGPLETTTRYDSCSGMAYLLDRHLHHGGHLIYGMIHSAVQAIFLHGKQFFPQLQHLFPMGKRLDVHDYQIALTCFGR